MSDDAGKSSIVYTGQQISVLFVRTISQFWWVVIGSLLIGAGLLMVWGLVKQPVYQSTSTLYLTTPSESDAAAAYQGSLASQQRAASYVKLVDSEVVLRRAISDSGLDLSLDDARDQTSAAASVNTVLLTISVRSPDPVEAADLANGVSKAMVSYVRELETPDNGSSPLAKLTVVSPAVVASNPASIGPRDLAVIGAALGALLGVLGAFLFERFDTAVRDVSDVSEIADGPLLGLVPSDGSLQDNGVIDFAEGSSVAAESFRKVRANLAFSGVDLDLKVVLITSGREGEGKTTAACNLAAALAESGARTLLVDGDLRRPSVAQHFQLSSGVGLADFLCSDIDDASAVIQVSDSTGLHVLTAGSTLPPNPAELVGSRKASLLIRDLRTTYDYVIIDSPPVLPVADAIELAKSADGVILVARANQSKRQHVALAAEALGRCGTPLLGFVINDVSMSTGHTYYGGRYGRYTVGASRGQEVNN